MWSHRLWGEAGGMWRRRFLLQPHVEHTSTLRSVLPMPQGWQGWL